MTQISEIAFNEVLSVPVVCTAYVTEHDMELVGKCDDSANPIVCYPYPHGAWVYIDSDASTEALKKAMIEHGYSEKMVALYLSARSQGYPFLRLDADFGDVSGAEYREW